MKTTFTIITSLLFIINTFSQALDNSFGVNGKVLDSFGSANTTITDIVVLPDNKLITTGYKRVGSKWCVSLCKFNEDGSLDSSFGTNGKIISTIGYEGQNFNSEYVFYYKSKIVIQTDGKIIVSASNSSNATITGYDFAMIRYNANGTLDTSFGNNGVVITDFNNNTDYCRSIVLQNDGKIVLAGDTVTFNEGQNFLIIRYNGDGSLDSTFGSNGKTDYNFSSGINPNTNLNLYPFTYCSASSIKIQSNGKLIIGGGCNRQDYLGTNSYYSLLRLNIDGTVDTTFGVNGEVKTIPGAANLLSLAIGNNDEIIAGGFSQTNSNNTRIGLIYKYNSNGILDETFGTDGYVTYQEPSLGGMLISEITVQNDNKILAAGFLYNIIDNDYFILRLNTDGSFDTSFDTDGILNPDFVSYDVINTLSLQNGGEKIIIGGQSNFRTAVIRYNSTGLSNQNFNLDEPFKIYPNPANDFLNIQNKNNYTIDNVAIIDFLGKIIIEQNHFNSEINLKNLQKGFYFVKVTSENKNFIYKFYKN